MSGAGPNAEPPRGLMPAEVVDLIRDLTDPDACQLDRQGRCRKHGWTATKPACPHVRARQFLAKHPGGPL